MATPSTKRGVTEELPPGQPLGASNTLIVYDLAASAAQQLAQELDKLPLTSGIPLPSFGRVLAVFDTYAAAELAYEELRSNFSVVWGEPMAPHTAPQYLEPPDRGTLLFTSPPPSPPPGWEGFPEEAPNTTTHFEEELSGRLRQALLDMPPATGDESLVLQEASHGNPAIEIKGPSGGAECEFERRGQPLPRTRAPDCT